MCVVPFIKPLFCSMLATDLQGADIITWDTPHYRAISFYAITLTMDAVIRPGILVDDFLSMVVLCSCGILTSFRAFSAHICQFFYKCESVALVLSILSNQHSLMLQALDLGANPVGEILRKLDCMVEPGVPVEQFLSIVVQCPCGIITTRRAFFAHRCHRILIGTW